MTHVIREKAHLGAAMIDLLSRANAASGEDNVTAVIIGCSDSD
jgi:hypothetical protein